MNRRIALALMGWAVLAPRLGQAQSSVSKIEISDPWARLPAAGSRTTQVYLTVRNSDKSDDALLSISSPWAERAILGRNVPDGYRMKFERRDKLRIKRNGRTKLSPSATFIVLENLTFDIRPGMNIPITLRFENAGRVEVKARVTNQLLGNMN